MKIAYSPCPNDTFVFHALTHGLIEGAPSFDVTYADIDVTNHLAIESDPNQHDVMKISFAALPWVLNDYALLSCGGALGRGCGPLVLTADEEHHPAYLRGKRVAVPSERSTAYILFRLWAAQQVEGDIGEIVVMPFHDIMPAVQKGDVDAGLVIHEARFTYQNYGLHKLVDLGDWWEKDTGHAIPLGAIIARRSIEQEALTGWIKQSIDYAWENPQASKDYVREHAQEMDDDVAQSHINLYVNEFTKELGEEGYEAIETFLYRAANDGLVPDTHLHKLRD
ncbi:1,4-dihydroxy-6-naphthoate synthase [Natribacillus halophilus]|uniref:1,4-dihydroxy-6-naphtoate synthase n=1 Tax=Natribacillus halophilus TaxID=549003 RepID=A0A1G8PH57_9BACI|nr:1,4-dihydroxy-6-naphthoate synthase [Natribacillus halophilus]SDI91803.1 1,4-dihydroxy-6-naphthoate synthase [Natribacillus halophilus]